MLQSLLLHAAGLRQDLNKLSRVGDNANLGYLRRLLREGPDGIYEEMKTTRLNVARKEYDAYMNCTSPNFRFGVISGLIMRLNLWINPRIAALTEVSDVNISTLSDKLFTIYLATPIQRNEYTPLSALIFNYFFSSFLDCGDRLKLPLALYLDEFTNFGFIPGIDRGLTVIRNAGIGAAIGVQDLVQLEAIYGKTKAQIFFGQPATKVFFGTTDDVFAARLSRMAGNVTDQELLTPDGRPSHRVIPRPLIESTELMRLNDEMVVATAEHNPFKVRKLSSWIDYAAATNLSTPARSSIHADEQVQRSKKTSDSTTDTFFKNQTKTKSDIWNYGSNDQHSNWQYREN